MDKLIAHRPEGYKPEPVRETEKKNRKKAKIQTIKYLVIFERTQLILPGSIEKVGLRERRTDELV